MVSRWLGTAIDATDPARLARWWAEVLGYRIMRDMPDEVAIGPDDAAYPGIVFVGVPGTKAGRNRLHLEIEAEDQAAEVERLVDMGARPVDIGQPADARWVVLADPEGNEFCVLPAAS